MKKMIFALAAIVLLQPLWLSAQMPLFASPDSGNGKKGPTKINSDAMDIDMARDKATFMGNVIVDNPEMYITCRKMIVYLARSKKDGKMVGSKKISHIECIEDVVITMKKNNQNGESQKAIAGHADYDLGRSTVTLTINPILINGNSRVTGERITLHTKSSRVEIVSGRILSDNLESSN